MCKRLVNATANVPTNRPCQPFPACFLGIETELKPHGQREFQKPSWPAHSVQLALEGDTTIQNFRQKRNCYTGNLLFFFKTLKALILHYSQKSFPFLLCINQSSNKTIKNPTATIKMSQNFFAKYFKGHDIHLKKKMVSTYSLNSAYSRSRIACVDWKIRGTGWLQWLYTSILW